MEWAILLIFWGLLQIILSKEYNKMKDCLCWALWTFSTKRTNYPYQALQNKSLRIVLGASHVFTEDKSKICPKNSPHLQSPITIWINYQIETSDWTFWHGCSEESLTSQQPFRSSMISCSIPIMLRRRKLKKSSDLYQVKFL